MTLMKTRLGLTQLLKLDYERYKSRVDHAEKKTNRSDRENTALSKHQIDLERATQVSRKSA